MDEYTVDTILCPDYVFCGGERSGALSGHAVVIRDGAIVDILPTETALGSYTLRNSNSNSDSSNGNGNGNGNGNNSETGVIELPQTVLVPAYVDAHSYAALVLGQGAHGSNTLAKDGGLVGAVSSAWVDVGSRLGLPLALATGTTTTSELTLYSEPTLAVALSLGLRVYPGHAILPGPWRDVAVPSEGVRRALDQIAAAERDAAGSGVLPGHALVLEDVAEMDEPLLERAIAVARARDVPLKVVLPPTTAAASAAIAVLDALGGLGPRTVVVHPAALDTAALDRVVEARCKVVYAPAHDLAVGAPMFDLRAAVAAGLEVGLATTGGARAASLDMLDTVRTVAQIQNSHPDPELRPLAPAEVLALGSWGSARVLGLESRLGSLERGMQADCVAYSLDHPALALFADPLDALVLGPAAAQRVVGVWSSGVQRLDAAAAAAAAAAPLARAWQAEGWVMTGDRVDKNAEPSAANVTGAVVNLPGRPPLHIDYDAILAEYLE